MFKNYYTVAANVTWDEREVVQAFADERGVTVSRLLREGLASLGVPVQKSRPHGRRTMCRPLATAPTPPARPRTRTAVPAR